jgi:hypothetical protein
LPTGTRSQKAEPICTIALTFNPINSPRRNPVRANSSITKRVNRSVSARAAASSFAAVASSRNRGSGLSLRG